MNILGLDTSTRAASVALIKDGELVGEYVINDKRTHSQKLLPMLESLLKIGDINLKDIDMLAVCVGPGSFTGLRIAMSTVKAISHVEKIPIVAVNSLESLAYNIFETSKKIIPILDAQRNQVYTAKYTIKGGKLIEEEEIKVVEIEKLIEDIDEKKEDVIVLGEAVSKYEDILVNEYITLFRSVSNVSKASSVCSLSVEKIKENKDVYNCYDILPMYIRKSQAEMQYEELQRKNK